MSDDELYAEVNSDGHDPRPGTPGPLEVPAWEAASLAALFRHLIHLARVVGDVKVQAELEAQLAEWTT